MLHAFERSAIDATGVVVKPVLRALNLTLTLALAYNKNATNILKRLYYAYCFTYIIGVCVCPKWTVYIYHMLIKLILDRPAKN